jgi:hypothetical protein
MKNVNLFAAFLTSLITLTTGPAFATSLEKADTTTAAAQPSLNTAPVDSAKSVAQVKKENVDDDEDKEDTLFHFKFEHPRHLIHTLNKYTDSMTKRGFGCGGGPMAGLYAVNIKPFIDLAQRVSPLRGKNFSFGDLNYKSFFMSGGMGFVGLGNGLRLGGGGMSGVRHFPSSRYAQDSTVNYKTSITWGGFLIEKFVKTDKYSSIIGGYIGSGSLDAEWVEINENYSAFTSYKNDFNDDNNNKIKAYFGFFELHAGIVYDVVRFIHLCGDLSLPVIISSDGFAPLTKEFISVSPGVRVRVIFGNMG